MSSSNLVRIGYKKENTLGTTPAAVKASKVIEDITLTAINGGEQGNLFSVEKLDTVSAGAEVVTITGRKITIAMEDGVSTATQIMAALTAATAALTALGVSFALTGTGSDVQSAAAVSFFTGGSGSWRTARFTSEKYSGTPQTTESAQIRTDRQSSGQVITGLTVEGGHNIELAKERAIEDFMESAMFNAWETSAKVSGVNLTIDVGAQSIARGSGSFIDDEVVVGDFIELSNFAAPGNNVVIMATEVAAGYIKYAGPAGMSSVTESADFQVCDKLSIGITKKPLTVEKTFLDLSNKAIIYRGSLVSQMELSIAYGSLISGSFTTMSADYDPVDAANEFASYQEYFDDAATTNSLNGSVDMPFIATDVTGTWTQDQFCLQGLTLSLNNNLTVQNCIGKAAPEDFSPGTAAIQASLSSYLKDANWDLLARKLSQEAFALGFMVQNPDGWYGFYIPAIQVSFDDPQSGGANQEISMEMTGIAKVGANGESALTIYREPSV